MKYIFKLLIVICLSLTVSCNSDDDIKVNQDDYYKILSFKTSSNIQIDLNNDGKSNSNILNELTNYATFPYDLEIKSFDNQKLYSLYLPNQNIQYDLNCCPNGYVKFARNGFTINLKHNITSSENIEIDNNNYIINFSEQNNDQMKLVLRKKYLDFNNLITDNIEFEIIYEKAN